MVAPNYKHRQSMGWRYGKQDPAQADYWRELELQYGLLPGRQARELQESQFQRSQAQTVSENEKNRESAAKEGQMGTLTNLTGMGLMGYGMYKGAFGGNATQSYAGQGIQALPPPNVEGGMYTGQGISELPTGGSNVGGGIYTNPETGMQYGTQPQYYTPESASYPVNPATTDTAGMGASEGADLAGTGGTEAGGSVGSTVGTVGAVTALIQLGNMARQAGGGKNVPVGQRNFTEHFTTDPLSGPPAWAAGKVFGTHSWAAKQTQAMERSKETMFANPIEKISKGDMGGVLDLATGPITATKDILKKVFGGW